MFAQLPGTVLTTLGGILPILVIVVGFHVLVLRRRLAQGRRITFGFVYVTAGLACFLLGLEAALFPLGRIMAEQLTALAMLVDDEVTPMAAQWRDFYWVYAFAAAIGFATTVAEPALIAVAMKAEEISGGAVSSWGLRVAVAVGVALGVALGTLRIVTGGSLYYFIIAGYIIVILQTIRVERWIIPLAYDSGGVTTSTVTVPLVAALGLGLATSIPGRSPLVDGFGLIAFASLFPMISVMGYAQMTSWWQRRRTALGRET